MKKSVVIFSILSIIYLILLGLYIKDKMTPMGTPSAVNSNSQQSTPATPSVPTDNEVINLTIEDRDIVQTADGQEIGQAVDRKYVAIVDDWVYYYKEQKDSKGKYSYGDAGIYKYKVYDTSIIKVANTTYNLVNPDEHKEISDYDLAYIQKHHSEFLIETPTFKVDGGYIFWTVNNTEHKIKIY